MTNPSLKRQHQHTLEALFSHPLPHGLRASRVEALLHALGAEVTPMSGRRLQIRLPGGQGTWIQVGEGVHHPDLDPEAVQRVRHLLEEAGVTQDHPEAEPATAR